MQSLTPTEKHVQLFDRLLERYGFDAQLLKTVEELSELSVQLMHFRDGKADKWQVCEEIADCLIMCQQMAIVVGEDTVSKFYVEKLLSIKKRFECNAV